MQNHGIILGGYYQDSDAFVGRSPGSYRIATFCKSIGWETEVIDYVTFFDVSVLCKLIEKIVEQQHSKWIGLSYNWLVLYADKIKELFSIVKKNNPDIKIIIGSQHPKYPDLNADWYIFGYGEEALEAILKHEFDNDTAPISKELHNGRYIDAVKNYPSVSSKVYNISYKETDFLNSSDTVSLELSRGCKFKCKYCNFPFIGIKEDTSTEEEILYKELNENYQKWGVTNYTLADDTFNDRTEKLQKLANVVKKLDFEPNFACFARLDLLAVNPDMIKLLIDSRVWSHYYGVETFNRKAGIAIGKGMDPERQKDTLLKVREEFTSSINAYRGTLGLIAGLPYEDLNSLHETENWIKNNWSDQNRVWWPLGIYKEGNNLSAFGENFKNYGYREIKQDIKAPNVKMMEFINWENDLTNLTEVSEFCISYKNDCEPLNNFHIMQYIGLFGLKKALNMKMSQREVLTNETYMSKVNIHVSKYIAQKMAYFKVL